MKRPNILLIYTDQQRWDAMRANGNVDVQTPNLERLAREGVNFDHFFVQNPVCMPSRVSFLTGQYPSTLGITSPCHPFRPKWMQSAGTVTSVTANSGWRGRGLTGCLDKKGRDTMNEERECPGTVLHLVAHLNVPELTLGFLDEGADVNARDSRDGWTPLHIAAAENADKTAEALLSRGADVNAKGNSGWTPLRVAVLFYAGETAEILLNHGADINARDNDGETPLQAAEERNNREMVALLRRHGD